MKNITFLILAIFLVFSNGCSNKVRYSLMPEFEEFPPRTIAVMPIDNALEEDEDKPLLRSVINERLKQLGYKTMPLEGVDKEILSLQPEDDGANDGLDRMETARLLGVDAVMYTTITEWNKRLFLYYASLTIGVRFELYNIHGEKVWTAEYRVGESDISADRKYLRLLMHETYEPMVVNLVSRAFSTLPSGILDKGIGSKEYYDWLP
ncbi:MAG: hypothetical protein V3T96_03460 [Thermodesulfobacteriota bacterium]